MSEQLSASPYAPPRAGRVAGIWRVWFATRRRLILANRQRRFDEKALQAPLMLLAVACVPLLGLRFSPHRLLLLLAAPVLVISLYLAVEGYGDQSGSIPFGIAIAIHSASVGAYVQTAWPAPTTLFRIVRQTGIALAVMLLSILSIPRLLSVIVLRVPVSGGVLLINPHAHSAPYAHGERMAFRLRSYGTTLGTGLPDDGDETEPEPDAFQHRVTVNGIDINPGLYLGRVLALPGDRVSFTPGFFSVNEGPRQPALPLMPPAGHVTVPTACILVWPVETTIWAPHGPGNWSLPPEALLLRKSALVGRPYKRWFWRTFTP